MTLIRRMLISVAAMASLTGSARAAQTSGPNAAVTATIDAAMAAGVSGDIRAMRDRYAPDCTFIDEFAPFLWSGPDAIDAYLMAGGRMYQETQHRDGKTTFLPPAFIYVLGDRAFVVEPLRGTAMVRGRPYSQQGAYAFTLARIDGRWKITSQTWTKSRESSDPYR
jgi:ketosteroid isomerase-like protein